MFERTVPSRGELDPKAVAELQETCTSLFELYSSTFNFGRRVNVAVLPPIEEVRTYLGDSIDMNIPRGNYNLVVRIRGLSDQQLIAGVEFRDDTVYFVYGDPTLVDRDHPDQVFRTILAHELIHSQIVPRAVVGVNPPPLLPRDIRFGGDIHYVLGFKAVSMNLRGGTKLEPTKPLDEYVTQYLAMSMTKTFGVKDPVLEKMKGHGLGISAHYILGAEILHEVFSRRGITPQMVEQFHHESDIRGFLTMLSRVNPELSRNVLRAGIDSNSQSSLSKLEQTL